MKAEELANDLYERLFRTGRHLHDPVPIDPMAIITDAIKQAHRKILEEAALAVHIEHLNDAPDCGHAYNNAVDDCEQTVRALIEQEGI